VRCEGMHYRVEGGRIFSLGARREVHVAVSGASELSELR
jgi:hypothetical protein